MSLFAVGVLFVYQEFNFVSFKGIVSHLSRYGLHPSRSGGGTAAVHAGVVDELETPWALDI